MNDRKKITKILLISLSNLGDIILTTPVFMALVRTYPEAKIDVLAGAPGKVVFLGHPSLGETITAREHRSFFGRINLIKYLKKKQYNLIVDLKQNLMSYLVGADLVQPLFDMFTNPGIKQHKVYEHLSKLRFLDVNGTDLQFYIHVSEDDKKIAREIIPSLESKKYVLVSPGSKSHLKKWSADNYAQLIEMILKNSEFEVYLAGDDSDTGCAGEIYEKIKHERVINICGKTTIGTLTELSKYASVIVTNDSAPLHVASAVNVPTVAIFGPTDEREYGPLSDKSIVIKPEVDCRPCGRALCKTGQDEGCINSIEVKDVFEAVRDFFK